MSSYLNVHTCVTKQYNLILTKGVISLAGKVTVGLVESNGSLPAGLRLMSPAGWLPRNRDQLRRPNARNRVWDYFTFAIWMWNNIINGCMYIWIFIRQWLTATTVHNKRKQHKRNYSEKKTYYEKDRYTKKLITVLVLFAKLLRNVSRLLHNSSSI